VLLGQEGWLWLELPWSHCCPGPGAAVDLTLLANLRLTDPQRFFLTCVSGEAGAGRGSDAWGPPLLLEKDDRIVRTFPPGQPLHLARNGSHQVTLRGFSKPSDLVGVFSCVGGAGARRTRVLYVHNSPGGKSGLRRLGRKPLRRVLTS
jgi:tyrosine kinase receptor 1